MTLQSLATEMTVCFFTLWKVSILDIREFHWRTTICKCLKGTTRHTWVLLVAHADHEKLLLKQLVSLWIFPIHGLPRCFIWKNVSLNILWSYLFFSRQKRGLIQSNFDDRMLSLPPLDIPKSQNIKPKIAYQHDFRNNILNEKQIEPSSQMHAFLGDMKSIKRISKHMYSRRPGNSVLLCCGDIQFICSSQGCRLPGECLCLRRFCKSPKVTWGSKEDILATSYLILHHFTFQTFSIIFVSLSGS